MFLFLMITSFFQKSIEVLSQNGLSGSLGCVILPVKMQFIVWFVFYLVTSFLKRHQNSKNFIPNLLDISHPQPQPVKYMLKGKKERKFWWASLHSKTWPILSNIMAHLKGSGEEIEVMLTKSSDKEVQKNRNKLKPIVDTVILLGRLGLPFRGLRNILNTIQMLENIQVVVR